MVDGRAGASPFLAPLALATALLAVSTPARAVDPFEIQVYDGTANPRGVAGLELHLNYVASGLRSTDPPELPPHHQLHLTFEPSFGVTDWWEPGAYLQTALRPDGTFGFAGVKLRSKLVTTRGFHPAFKLGLNLEVSYVPSEYERSRFGMELRPIVAWERERLRFAINPILSIPLGAPDAAAGPAFEPAALVRLKLPGERVELGLEYYAGLGPLSGLLAAREQEHFFFQTVDIVAIKRLELQVAIGEGLTRSSNGLVLKAIIGWSFDDTP